MNELAFHLGAIITIILLVAHSNIRLFSFMTVLVVTTLVAHFVNFFAHADPEEFRALLNGDYETWLEEQNDE